MSAAVLLERLHGVRGTGSDRGTARCPGPLHRRDDRSPSLSWRVLEDGRLLIHCFAGCAAGDILASVGLTLRDLYPRPIVEHGRPVRANLWHARQAALDTLRDEALFLILVADDMAAGVALEPADRARLEAAGAKLRRAAEMCR